MKKVSFDFLCPFEKFLFCVFFESCEASEKSSMKKSKAGVFHFPFTRMEFFTVGPNH
jgi:hypothetical protein